MKRTAQYFKLYEILRRQIIEGNYTVGDLLPSENELKSTYNLSQPTVRKAVELLEKEGFVRKYHGKGSIIQPRPVGAGILSFEGDLFTTQNDSKRIITKIIRKPFIINELPSVFLFPPVNIKSDDGFWCFERRRSVENKVIFYETLYLPNQNLPRFKQLKLDNLSFYEKICRKYEIITTGFEQRFWAISANEKIAGELNNKVGDPVQRLQRRFSTNRPGFYILSDLTANTDSIFLFNNSK